MILKKNKSPRCRLIFGLVVGLIIFGALSTSGAAKPVGVQAVVHEGHSFANFILIPNDMAFEVFSEEPIPLERYQDFSVLIFGERALPSDVAEREIADRLREYLEQGGIVIVTASAFPPNGRRSVPMLADLLGFGRVVRPGDYNCVRITDAFASDLGEPEQMLTDIDVYLAGDEVIEDQSAMERCYNWVLSGSGAVDLLGDATVLAWFANDGVPGDMAFATVHEVGNGRIYWFGSSLFRLVRAHPADVDSNAYSVMLLEAVRRGQPQLRNETLEEWIPIPLG